MTKKLITLALICMTYVGVAQYAPSTIGRIENATTPFSINLPKSTMIIDQNTWKAYFLKVEQASTKTIATMVADTDYLEFATSSSGTFVPYTGATANVDLGTYNLFTPKVIGGTSITSDLFLQTTSGVGTTGADMHFLVGNNGGTEAMTLLNSGFTGIGTSTPEALFTVGGGSTSISGITRRAVITANEDAINALHLQNLSSGTNSEMRFLSISDDGAYLAFSQPSSTNTGTFFGITKSTGSFIFTTAGGANERDFYIGTRTAKSFNIATNQLVRMTVLSNGNVGIGTNSPTAVLHLKAGTATAGTAPLKLTSGTLLTTPEVGTVEFNNNAFYGTITIGAVRKQFAFTTDIYPTAGIAKSTGSAWATSLTSTSIGENILTKTNPSAITFLRANADNTVDFLSAADFRTAIGAISGNQSITLNGDVSGSGTTAITTTIGSDKILESMLKCVNSPTDEYVLTYESTTGDFEWQAAGGGGTITGSGTTNYVSKFTSSTAIGNSLIFDNGTNVGIGTASPGAKLDVAGRIWQTGVGNSIFIGKNAGKNDDLSDNQNVFVGDSTALSNTSGSFNVAIGKKAYYSNLTGDNNTAIGFKSLYSNTTGLHNTGVGFYSLYINSDGDNNVAVGEYSLANNISADKNTAVGNYSLYNNNTGIANTGVGYQSLRGNTTGNGSVAVGESSLYSNTTGGLNTAVGSYSLYTNVTGMYNAALGYEALYKSTESYNTGIGYHSLYENTTGEYNTGIGRAALLNTTTGIHNTSLGNAALLNNTTGKYNIGIGTSSGSLTNSGGNNQVSDSSIYIGYDSRSSASGNYNEIVIGNRGRGEGTNTVSIGNNLTTKTVLKGNTYSNSFIQTTQTLTSAASVTFDVSKGGDAKLTLAHNVTSFTFSNLVAGSTGNIYFYQDASTGYAVTFTNTRKIATGNISPVVSTTLSSVTIVSYLYDGTTLFLTSNTFVTP